MTDNSIPGKATAGKVLAFNEGNTITLPKWFKAAIDSERGLLVFIRKSQHFKIFPTKSDGVTFVSIEIINLSHNFMTRITSIFEDAGINNILFSTGVCYIEDICYYEAYFDSDQLKIEMEDLEKELSKLPEVKNVILEKLVV